MLIVAMGLLISEDGTKEQKLMCYFLAGCLVQNVGYLLEWTASTIDAALVAVKIQYLGSIFVPLCYCWFIYRYCYNRPPKKLLKLLGIFDLVILAVIFCSDHHQFYYKNVRWLVTEGGHHYLNIDYGPGYIVFLCFGCLVPYFLTIRILIRTLMTRSRYANNRRYGIIFILSALPLISLFAYAGKLTYVFDPTPLVLGLTLSTVAVLIWRGKTFDFKRLAAEVVLSSMGDGTLVLDDQKRILNYNQAAADIFPGLSTHRIGDSIEDISTFQQGMLEEDTKMEFSLGERHYESHSEYIRDKSGKKQGYVVLVLDITDTKNYIQEIKDVREQAEKANMAKSEFLANMSHEIRTPMNAIMGLSDIIIEESKGRKMYSYAKDIKSASQNLLAIINDILDLSKVEAGKMELVPGDYYIKSVVDEIVNMMDLAASQRGLLMKYKYDMNIPCQYNGDAGRIKQILINLLNNAIKFTKQGYVQITIGGKPGETEEDEILMFEVKDTGCGIKEEDHEQIFENFKQVDSKRNRSVEGTGLGLSITKHLVDLMNGTIQLASVYGEGTTFTVTIPQKIVDKRTLAEAPQIQDIEEEITPFTANGYKVLVVDDNTINRRVAKGFLKDYQFDLSEAASGYEAISLVRQTKFDIIFMDHMMPEMDGIETAHIIRNECGENGKVPNLIALTANAMEGVKERFLLNGFQDFIAKPLDRRELDKVLSKWIPDDRKTISESPGKNDSGTNSEYDFSSIQIQGISNEAIVRHQAGSVADYKEILELYCIDGERKTTLLRNLFEDKDYATYEIEVHGLKSASANIGAMDLSDLAKEHEHAAARGDEEYIKQHFTDLIQSYETQLQHIQHFLDERQEKTDNSEDLPEIDLPSFTEMIREALKQLEDFHSRECANRIDVLLNYNLTDDLKTKLKEIQTQLRLYEDDEAERLLQQLLEWLSEEDL